MPISPQQFRVKIANYNMSIKTPKSKYFNFSNTNNNNPQKCMIFILLCWSIFAICTLSFNAYKHDNGRGPISIETHDLTFNQYFYSHKYHNKLVKIYNRTISPQ